MLNPKGLTIRTNNSMEAYSSQDSLPSPKSEEAILDALKEEASLLTPRREIQQEKWNRELLLKIVGVAKFVHKAKALRSNRSVNFDAANDDPSTPNSRDSMDVRQRTPRSLDLSRVPSITKITQLVTTNSNENSSQSRENNPNGHSRGPSLDLAFEAASKNSSMHGSKTTSSYTTSDCSSSVSSPRGSRQVVVFQEAQNEARLLQDEEDSQSINSSKKKVSFSCETNTDISISTTEKRKLARKWSYVKSVIGDIQEALRENPNSIETANLIEESAQELQHIVKGMDVSIDGLVAMLKKIESEIKNQNLDIERVKKDRSLKLTNERNTLNDSYEKYKETAKQCKKALELQENKLERVLKRRQSQDVKILDQLDKIEKIKIELAEAEEELENLERDRYHLLEEEDECKDQASGTKSELREAMKKIDVMRDNMHKVDFQLENLNEEIDHEFDERKKEMLDLVGQLLDLEVS